MKATAFFLKTALNDSFSPSNNKNERGMKNRNVFEEGEELQDIILPQLPLTSSSSLTTNNNTTSPFYTFSNEGTLSTPSSLCTSDNNITPTQQLATSPASLSFANRFLNQFSLPNLIASTNKVNKNNSSTPNLPRQHSVRFDIPSSDTNNVIMTCSTMKGSNQQQDNTAITIQQVSSCSSTFPNTPHNDCSGLNSSSFIHEKTLSKRKIHNSSSSLQQQHLLSFSSSLDKCQVNSDRSLLENPQDFTSSSRTHEIIPSKKQSLQSSLSLPKLTRQLKIDDCWCVEGDCNHKTSLLNHHQEETKQYQQADSSPYCWCDRSNILNCSCSCTGSHHHNINNSSNSSTSSDNINIIDSSITTPPSPAFVCSPSREALFHQFKPKTHLINNIRSLLIPPSSRSSLSVDNLINLMTESEHNSTSSTTDSISSGNNNNNSNIKNSTTGTSTQQQQDNHSSLLLENLCSRYRRIIEDVCILSLNSSQINEIVQAKYGECLKATLETPPSTPSSPAEEEEKNADEESVNNKPSNVIIHVKREATLIDNYPKEKKKKSSSHSSDQQHFLQEDSFLGGSDLTPLSLQFFTFPNDIIAQLIACKKSNDSPLIEEDSTQEDTNSSPLEFELKCIDARKHTLLKDIFSGEEQLESLENNNSNDQEEDQEEDYEHFIEQSKIHPPARSYHTFINTDAYGFKYYGFCYTKFFTYRVCNVTRNGKPIHNDNVEFFIRYPSCICILSRYAFHSTFLKFYSFLDQYLFENNDGFYCSDCGYFTFNEELLKYVYDFFNNTDPNATPATPSGFDINISLPALYDKLVVHFPSMAITSPSDYVFTSKTSTDPSSNCINEVKVEFDKMLFVGTKEEHFKEASPIDKHHHQPSSPSNSSSPTDVFDENTSKPAEKVPFFPMCDFDYSILTTCLSIDNIITIVNYLSLEKSLIFHSVNLYRMVMVMESLRHLIYPFRMTSIYIPIAHEKIINFLEAPFPYMVGTHSEVMWNHFRIGFEKKSSPFRRTLCSQFEAPSSSQKVNVLNLNETKFSNKDNMDYEMINIPEGVCIVNLDEDVIRFVGEENEASKGQWKWSSALMQYIKDAVEKSRSNFEKSNSEYMNQIIKKRDAQIPSLTRRGSSFFFKGRKKGASTFIKNQPSVKNILESSEEVEVTGKDPLSSGLFSPSASSNDNYLSPSLTRKRSAAVRPSATLTQKDPPASTVSTPRLSISNSQSIISKRKKSVMAVAQENQVSPLLKVHPIREIFLNVFIRLLTCYEIFIQFDQFDPKNDMNMTDIFNIEKFLSLDNYGGFTPGSSQGSQSFNPFQLKDKTINKKLLMALTHYGNYGGHVDSVFLREFFKTQIFHYFIQKKCELFWNISNSFKSNTPEGNMPMKRTDFAQSLPDLFVQHDNMIEQNKQLSEHVLASTVTNTFYKLFDYKMQQSTERFSLNLSLMQSSYRRSFLYKRGRFRKSWKKRFFVLRDDNTMLYYEGSDETQLKGSIKLTSDGLTKVFSVKVNEKRIFEKNSESEEDSYFTWTKSQQIELASLLKFARAMNQSEDSGNANNNEEEGVPSTSEQFPTPYVFVVFVPGGRLLYCCAESEKAREEWIKVLRAKVMQSNVTSSLQDYLNRLKWQQSKKNFNKKIIINSVGHIINHQPSTSSISHIQSSPNLVNSPASPVTAIHQQPLVLHKIFDFVPIAFRNSSERYKERNSDLDIQSISTRMPLEEFTLRSCLEVIN